MKKIFPDSDDANDSIVTWCARQSNVLAGVFKRHVASVGDFRTVAACVSAAEERVSSLESIGKRLYAHMTCGLRYPLRKW